MQISRLFEMVYLLMNQKSMTAKELAARFEVSTRTILRDVDTLAAAGIPIYATQGKGGGISLMEGYVLNKSLISKAEQSEILFALKGLSAVQNEDAEKVFLKWKRFFDMAEMNWIEVDFSRWGGGAEDRLKFDIIKRGILKKTAIGFLYSDSYGRTGEKKVYPLKLVFKTRAWYLRAYVPQKEDYRTFRITRMREVQAVEESFADQVFSPSPVEAESYDMESLMKVKLLFSPAATYRVYDEFDERDIVKNEDGSFQVSIWLPDDGWLYGYILSFGVGVTVLEPKGVREELLRYTGEIAEKYKE